MIFNLNDEWSDFIFESNKPLSLILLVRLNEELPTEIMRMLKDCDKCSNLKTFRINYYNEIS